MRKLMKIGSVGQSFATCPNPNVNCQFTAQSYSSKKSYKYLMITNAKKKKCRKANAKKYH